MPIPPRVECRVVQPETEKVDTRALEAPSRLPPDVLIARLAAEEWAVLSIAELRRCGLSDDGVWVRVRNGRLHPRHRGVYAVGHPNLTLQGQFLAAVKACGPTAILASFAAAAHLGFVRWDGRHPEVKVVGTSTRRHKGIHVHRTKTLDPRDVTRFQGIPVTTPARTLLDLAATMPYKNLRRAVREAQALQRVNVRQLLEVLERHPRRRGARNLARIVATGPAPTRSELENVVLDLILGAGFEHPDVNVPLVVADKRVVPDFRWPAHRLVVEADGAAFHDNPVARAEDAERQALLEADGERVLRVTWAQAVTRRTQTRKRLQLAGAPRLQGP
jgi:hypothetical protein